MLEENDPSLLKQDKHIMRAYNTPINQEWLQEFYKSSYDWTTCFITNNVVLYKQQGTFLESKEAEDATPEY